MSLLRGFHRAIRGAAGVGVLWIWVVALVAPAAGQQAEPATGPTQAQAVDPAGESEPAKQPEADDAEGDAGRPSHGDPAQAEPAEAPPDPPAEQDLSALPLDQHLQRVVDRTAAAVAREPRQAQHARRRIRTLHRAMLEPLLAQADHEDAEVRIRVLESLDALARNSRILRVMAKLPPDQRRKLTTFRTRHQVVFDEIFSEDLEERTRAVGELVKIEDPDRLAEPLIAMLLRHPDAAFVKAGLQAVCDRKYDSRAIVDGLLYRVNKSSGPGTWWDIDSSDSQAGLALEALRLIKAKRAARPLLEHLVKSENRYQLARSLKFAEALGATGEKRLIPTLLELLDERQQILGGSFRDTEYNTAMCDAPLLALIHLTGQRVQTYNMIAAFDPEYDDTAMGFAKDADREKAIKSFRAWLAEQQAKGRYKDIEPFPVKQQQPTRTWREELADQEPPRAPIKPLGPVDPDLQARIRKEIQAQIELFTSSRFLARNRAARQILAIGHLLDSALLEHADDKAPSVDEFVPDAMGDLIAQARLYEAMARLPAKPREAIAEYRRVNPTQALNLYSLSWYRRSRALRDLGTSEFARQAEPILLTHLEHGSERIWQGALAGLKHIAPPSDRTVQTVCRLLIEEAGRSDESDRDRGFIFRHHHMETSSDRLSGLLAFVQEHPDRRALPILLALSDGGWRMRNYWDEIFPAIQAIGDKRAVLHLIRVYNNYENSGTSSWTMDGKTVTMQDSDYLLQALIKLTGQKTSAYGFASVEHWGDEVVGFEKDEDRKAAEKKFMAWWDKHKKTDQYKDLKPLELPNIRGQDQPEAMPGIGPGVFR